LPLNRTEVNTSTCLKCTDAMLTFMKTRLICFGRFYRQNAVLIRKLPV
jgi:hypothetical protein